MRLTLSLLILNLLVNQGALAGLVAVQLGGQCRVDLSELGLAALLVLGLTLLGLLGETVGDAALVLCGTLCQYSSWKEKSLNVGMRVDEERFPEKTTEKLKG